MTNDTDEFDQEEHFDPMDASEDDAGTIYSEKESLGDRLRNSPILKLIVIVGVVGVALAGALGAFTDNKKEEPSKIPRVTTMSEAPGGSASQFFIEQTQKANEFKAREALEQGGSALPTPVGRDISEIAPPKQDPMLEFRAETERLKKELKAEQAQNALKVAELQRQMQHTRTAPAQRDDTLAQAMQQQMNQLMDSWAPQSAKVVKGAAEPEPKVASVSGGRIVDPDFVPASAAFQDQPKAKVMVEAGTVNYMQLLTEANSDVPGPVLGQILSGPLAGGRAIGAFTVANDYLVITFSQVSLKGKNYAINAIALDPNTTLGGMATEVDHRYFTRVLLPAAGEFMSAFGDALAETEVQTTLSDGTVLQDQANKGLDEALYAGLGSIGDTVSEFFKNQANQTKTLVRVAVGTPMGLFFITPVLEQNNVLAEGYATSPTQSAMATGYQKMLGVGDQAPQPSYSDKKDDFVFANVPGAESLTKSQKEMIQSVMSGQR